MKNTINVICTLLCVLFFAYWLVNFGLTYGTEWTFGPHGIPITKLSEDRLHYADGSDIDPASLATARSSHEEVIHVALFIFVVCTFTYTIRGYRKLQRETEAMERERYGSRG